MPHTPQTRARAYQKVKARKEAFFEGKSCVKCGSRERLELDHIVPSLKEHHQVWSWSEKRRSVELAKCQVLCRGCHLAKTKVDLSLMRTKPIVHGTPWGYRYKVCRCIPCKEAGSDYRRKIRAIRIAKGLKPH